MGDAKTPLESLEIRMNRSMIWESMRNIIQIFCTSISMCNRALQENSSLLQLSKFGLVGLLNTALGYGAFLLFLNYTNYMVSLIIAHIIGVLHSFIWNKHWTFKSGKIKLDEFIKFNSVYVIVFVVNAFVLILFVNILKLDPEMGQLIALPIVTAISFVGHKYWSFGKSHCDS